MLIAGQVGPAVVSDGVSTQPLRQGRGAEMVVTELHGRYYEQAYRGNLFYAANSAGVTSSAGLTATYLGICLSNPAGNTKNLVVLKVGMTYIVIPTVVTGFGLISGYATTGVTAHTTPLVPASTVIGTGTAPSAKADSACTIVGTPAWTYWAGTLASATTMLPTVTLDLEGSIIIPPGGYIATGTSAASPTSAFVGSILWEEVPV